MKTLATALIVYLLSPTTAGASAEAGIVIVCSPKNVLTSIELEDVKKIYLGKTRTFPNNQPAVPIDQAHDSDGYQEFLTKVIGKNVKEIRAFWSVKIYTGRGTPPAQMDNDAGVKEWLHKNVEGIGYIDQKAVDSTVKVLLKVP